MPRTLEVVKAEIEQLEKARADMLEVQSLLHGEGLTNIPGYGLRSNVKGMDNYVTGFMNLWSIIMQSRQDEVRRLSAALPTLEAEFEVIRGHGSM